ncbi:FadR/GntR family transcriptional regulator [Enterococcus crotali]|uniref:FadR/GntR family transcriptional regulator n=1 Tax=Enterococcus crotali TaxID=1453587 RepID=UPI00046E53B4|nr:FCD domain-containing protein [Enterococcus crotali]
MKNKNLVQETIVQLRQYIVSEEFAAGTKLPIEKQLAEKFGVGRSTLREAVKILEYSDLLEVRQGSGTFVKEAKKNHDRVKELIEAREMIESTAGKLACHNRTEEDLADLNQALFKRNRLLKQGQFAEYIQADLEFHLLMIKSSKNTFLIRWYQEIMEDLKIMLSGLVLDSKNYLDNTKQHQIMFEAVMEKDPEKLTTAILENSRRK